MTHSLTLFIKKSTPALVLLVAILMLSGCVGKALNSAIDRATDNAANLLKNAFPGIDIDDIDGIGNLRGDDPCLQGNAIFNNQRCLVSATNQPAYDGLREARCTLDNTQVQCAETITRVCGANFDNDVCTGIPIYESRRTARDEELAIARLNVVFADWRDGVTNENGAVIALNSVPNSTHTGNQFLTGLVLGTRTSAELEQSSLTPAIKAKTFAVTNLSDSAELTLGFQPEGTIDQDEERPFTIFKGLDRNGDETYTGDARDGVIFVSGLFVQQEGCEGDLCLINRHYAGLLPTTDLGAALTATSTPAKGIWQGWIQTRGDVSFNQRFDLTITFDEDTNGGTIDAYIINTENKLTALKIDGVFNDQGFVTGDILHGSFAPNNQIGSGQSAGNLRGLIGDEGAVVAFISTATGRKGGDNDDPRDQYSGGFVAYLPNPAELCIARYECVDYVHWVESAEPTSEPTPNRFLTGGPTGLTTGESDNGEHTLISTNIVGGDLYGGFAIFAAGNVSNAGILRPTRLGAPWKNQSVNVEWDGRFVERAGRGSIAAAKDFKLLVNFDTGTNAGTLSGTIPKTTGSTDGYSFTAEFDDLGIIKNGEIIRTAGTDTDRGILTGLVGSYIGFGGAVAVFHSDTNARTSFVGGFVAEGSFESTRTPTDCIRENTCVDYQHWAATDQANPTDIPMPNRFLAGAPNGLRTIYGDEIGGTLSLADNAANYSLGAGDAEDGFAIYRPDRTRPVHNVGIFSTTRLGAPLTGTINSAQWRGLFLFREGAKPVTRTGITLTISFLPNNGSGTRKISGESTIGHYEFIANVTAAGVINGTMVRTQDNDIRLANALSDGPIRGLIGEEGAVGVFHSRVGATVSFVGGFVAQPHEALSDPCVRDYSCVAYAHWADEDAANPTDAPTQNQFLKGTPNGLKNVIGGDIAVRGNLADSRLTAGGDETDGYAIYRPYRTTATHNVGILSTTNLGAPIRETINAAQWPGVLHARTGATAVTSREITLTVNFNPSIGTGTGTVDTHSTGGDYRFSATFNNRGVISGTMFQNTFTGPENTILVSTSMGVASGLIGEEGAVGVFHSNEGTTTSYVGGLLARPPASGS